MFADGEPVLARCPGVCARRCARPRCASRSSSPPATRAAIAWGCDLGYDYVKLNADYTSLIVQTPDGGLAKDDRLTNYSPSFKRKLIVEALSYISRFAGTRCVIKFGGAAMVQGRRSSRRSATTSSCCASVGLQPIVVHGGGPEITRTLEKLGHPRASSSTACASRRRRSPRRRHGAPGSINSHLVTLLNLDGAHALGISGKDGALLAREEARPRSTVATSARSARSREVNASVPRDAARPGLRAGDLAGRRSATTARATTSTPTVAAAKIAIALGAHKLIYLTDAAGILEHGELVSRSDGRRPRARGSRRADHRRHEASSRRRSSRRCARRRARARHRRPHAAHRDRRAVHRPRCRHAGDGMT